MSTAKHDTGQVSDGYHTFDELYRYRMLYHAWAVKAWRQKGWTVVKSHRHHDGEQCLGGGWFIVSAQLPSGQVSNHYEDQYWDLFDCPAVDRAPEWDGHTPQQAADRIERALRNPAQPLWKDREIRCSWPECGSRLFVDQHLMDEMCRRSPGEAFIPGADQQSSGNWVFIYGKGLFCDKHWHENKDGELVPGPEPKDTQQFEEQE